MTGTEISPAPRRIAALQGASSAQIQGLLGAFAARVARQGYRVAGVVEETSERGEGCCRRFALRDLSTGAIASISQDLGPLSTACNLDAGALAEACGRVERAIARGADLVVLSKFGKQEAGRGGLTDAFRAAAAGGLPMLTAVSPAMAEAWQLFAGPLSELMPPDPVGLDAWWSRVRPPQALRVAG